MEITPSEQQIERQMDGKKESSIWDLWNHLKHASLHTIRIPEGKKEEDRKCIWRNYGWTFSKPKDGNRYPGIGSIESPEQDEPSRPTPKYTIIKMKKVK